jgi:hypothetical protein
MFRISWVILIAILYCSQSYFSIKNSEDKSNFSFFMICFIAAIAIPIWPFISRYTNNLILDALLYDVILILSYSITMLTISNHSLSQYNYIGILFVVIGFILIKI